MKDLQSLQVIVTVCGFVAVGLLLIIPIEMAKPGLIRDVIRVVHEQWMKLGKLGQAMLLSSVTIATIHGGGKNENTTNMPPNIVGGDTTNEVIIVEGDSTNDVVIIEGDPTNSVPDDASSPTNTPPPMMMMGRSRPMMSPPPQQTDPDNLCSRRPSAISLRSIAPSTFTSITAWNKRGAYCDWVHITFPDDFAFPAGTNLLTGVTVMAYGEIRETLHCSPSPSTFTLSMPARVSLVPDESTFSYGLTASNSFLFSWQNVCVNRDATNRVDASIELFDSGAIAITVTPLSTPTPPTYIYIPPTPPEGFVGEGQDDDWLANAFPSQFAAITNGGYNAWLTDHIGHNEPNGRYKLSVTVAALPDHGPCYLVCGPYKMIVTSPGTYSFPLIDMTEYDLYTCPIDVPLTWEMDDGWDPPEPSYPPLFMSPAPRMLGAPRNDDNHYKVERYPSVTVEPNYMTREQAINEVIRIRCNAAGIAARDYRSMSGLAEVLFNQSEAIIRESLLQDEIYFYYRYNGREVCGVLFISPAYWWWWYDPYSTNDTSNASSTNDTSSASNP